jgi:hypothetical protein
MSYRELAELGVTCAAPNGKLVVSLITASAIDEFTDCTPGNRDR